MDCMAAPGQNPNIVCNWADCRAMRDGPRFSVQLFPHVFFVRVRRAAALSARLLNQMKRQRNDKRNACSDNRRDQKGLAHGKDSLGSSE
jgi:hypothetical protein